MYLSLHSHTLKYLLMDYTDINRCIEILNEKPGWFFQKDHIADKLECLETIQRIGTSWVIYHLIPFLRSDNVLLQSKTAETILVLFKNLDSLNAYTGSLKHLPIEKEDLDFYRVDFDERTYVQLLGITSLNWSGYVREKAVRELARLKSVEGLKFILLRLGDWVPAVRKAATEAILTFLEDAYLENLLQHLPTIDYLLNIQRVNLREVHDRIIQFILAREPSEAFFEKVTRLNDKTRLLFYKLFLSKKHPGSEIIIRLANDRNFLVRLEVIKHLPAFDIAIQEKVVTLFLHDKSARVRVEALYASKRLSLDFNNQVLTLLSDESATVRELARSFLKQKAIDFAALYRQRIADHELLAGSLSGLSETGSIEDLSTFEQYIHVKERKLVIACLTAINKFDSDKAKQHALALLVHPTKSIRSKAAEILARTSDTQTIGEIRSIYARSESEIRKTILTLYNKIGGWHIISDLLLALTSEDAHIQNLGWQLLERWKIRATTLFTTPPASELERANKILDSLNTNKLYMTPNRANLLQSLKFYLR